jgi:FlaA1/EpsC-like NDP-sugar epimerase
MAVPLVWIALGLFFVYLAKLQMAPVAPGRPRGGALLLGLMFKRRILEVVMDLALATISLCAAFLLRFDFRLDSAIRENLIGALPWAGACALASYQLTGVYRGLWAHQGLRDVFRFGKASALAGAALAGWAALALPGFPLAPFALFGLLLFVGVLVARTSFQLLDVLLTRRGAARSRVLVFGPYGRGLTAYWDSTHGADRPLVVGFLTDDPEQTGLKLHGLPIVGTLKELELAASRVDFDAIVLADPPADHSDLARLRHFAAARGKRLVHFRVFYEEHSTGGSTGRESAEPAAAAL